MVTALTPILVTIRSLKTIGFAAGCQYDKAFFFILLRLFYVYL